MTQAIRYTVSGVLMSERLISVNHYPLVRCWANH
jgi:hypothetical protein